MAKGQGYVSQGVAIAQRSKSKILIIVGTVLTTFWGFGVVGGLFDSADGLREGIPVYIVLMIPSVIMLLRGIKAGRVADTVRRCESIFASDKDGIVTLDELTRHTGRPASRILKDLETAFSKGYFQNCTLQTGSDPKVILANAKTSSRAGTGFITVTCVNCGGQTRIRAGSTGTCDYCGGPIKAE